MSRFEDIKLIELRLRSRYDNIYYGERISHCILKNMISEVKDYLGKGISPNLLHNGHTLLTLAVSEGRVTIVRELLKRGSDIYLRNGHGDSALDCKPKRYAGRINTLLQERKAFKNFLYGEVKQ